MKTHGALEVGEKVELEEYGPLTNLSRNDVDIEKPENDDKLVCANASILV